MFNLPPDYTVNCPSLAIVDNQWTCVVDVPPTPNVGLTRLLPSTPNPFNGSTSIRFELANPTTDVHLSVMDARGRHVRTLMTGSRPAGIQSIRWNGIDDQGQKMATGVYFIQLTVGGDVESTRVVLID